MRTLAQHVGYDVRPFFVLNPTPQDIASKHEEFDKRISYQPVSQQPFDKMSKMLSLEVLSNMERHVKAWTMICNIISNSPKDLYLVVEDDALLVSENFANYVELLLLIAKSPPTDWDMIFMGVSHNDQEQQQNNQIRNQMYLQDTRKFFKVLPSKDAYFVNKKTALQLKEAFSKTIRFSLRIQLSYFLHNNETIKVFNPSKQVTIDGSKLNMPTSIHEGNILIFNAEFMQLFEYISKNKDDITNNIDTIDKIYKSVEQFKNPDVMHLYGVLLFRAGRVKDATTVLTSALTVLQERQGLVNSRTEMLNNFIDMCKDMQYDLPDIMANGKSKYLGVL